jgi:ribosomal protein RSM22 (predicted rRNA methylase)
VQLPSRLRNAIEHEVSKYDLGKLTRAATELSEKYRLSQSPTEKFIVTEAQRLAYLAVRMPATFASSQAVLSEVRRLLPELRAESLLDLGAGPGTVAWAAVSLFDELRRITLVERDGDLMRLGQALARESDHPALRSADWQNFNFKTASSFPPCDLVVCSYALGEIEQDEAIKVLRTAWRAARSAMIIIEPGTVKGFELIRLMRDELIDAGGGILAPCPHQQVCPMSDEDWCHFARRFERTSLHRRIKSGALGYEDEKFSYIAAAKRPGLPIQSRVIRHPRRYPGYVKLQLCARDELRSLTVTRREKDAWKKARKADWGDEW